MLTGTIASAPPTAAGARTFENRDDGHAVAHILQPLEDKCIAFILISFHGCRQARRCAFISHGAHENTAGSMVHAVLVDYKTHDFPWLHMRQMGFTLLERHVPQKSEF